MPLPLWLLCKWAKLVSVSSSEFTARLNKTITRSWIFEQYFDNYYKQSLKNIVSTKKKDYFWEKHLCVSSISVTKICKFFWFIERNFKKWKKKQNSLYVEVLGMLTYHLSLYVILRVLHLTFEKYSYKYTYILTKTKG